MVVRSLDPKKYQFRHKEDDEKILGPEVLYLNAIGALVYLAQCTRPNIAFAVNLLARFSSVPIRRHWNGIKHVCRYLSVTKDFGLFYPRKSVNDPKLVDYTNAGYLYDRHKAHSHTGYVFTYNGTAISWCSTKQTLVATSSNHSEILALHEAN
ncbi:secreted RxLR effector protein 161-like [Pistacia vera]|uniref:secreted RxLR effector protein 161-like n=1 Tax=Pistacia vera TaxID=55513 RepID=UPI001262C0E6|nr:secreted RxLR effector protein 161-like [Pistacia vera]